MKITKKRRDELRSKKKVVATAVANPTLMIPPLPKNNNLEVIEKLDQISEKLGKPKNIVEKETVKVIEKNDYAAQLLRVENKLDTLLNRSRNLRLDPVRNNGGIIEYVLIKPVQ